MGMARRSSPDRALVERMVGEDVRLSATPIKDTQPGITMCAQSLRGILDLMIQKGVWLSRTGSLMLFAILFDAVRNRAGRVQEL